MGGPQVGGMLPPKPLTSISWDPIKLGLGIQSE